MDHLIPARRPDLMLRKKNCHLIDYAILANHRGENKNKKQNRQIFGPCQGTKLWDMRMMMMISILVGTLGTVSKCLEKIGRSGNQRKNWDHPDYSLFNVS